MSMWETEFKRAQAVIGWPTDGIPTVRPNLGVITLPAMAGQGFQTPENSMPWPGDPLSIEMIRAISESRLENSNVFRLAADFYGLYHQYHSPDIATYLHDNQSVFDISHLLYGDEIFYSIFDSEPGSFMTELMERCAETGTVLYSRIAVEADEDWKKYIDRIGSLVKDTRARVILRPLVFPDSKQECQEMLDRWHQLTSL